MRIFKKENQDEQVDEGREKAAKVLESLDAFTEGTFSTNKQIALLQKDVETVKALVDSLREMNKDDQERFQKVDEGIGELRNMLFDKEQELKDLKIQVGKAIDLVETAQVEKILVEKKREDAKLQMLEAKIESYKALLESFMSEVKSVRQKIDMFKGVEQIITLNNEVKENLSNVQRIDAQIQGQSDKMQNMFVDFSKKYDDYRNNMKDIENMKKDVQESVRKSNKTQIDMINVAKKEDLLFFEKEVAKRLHNIEDLRTRMNEALKNFDDKMMLVENMDTMSSVQNNFRKMNDWIKYMDERMKSLEAQNKKSQSFFNSWIKYLHGKVSMHDVKLRKKTSK